MDENGKAENEALEDLRDLEQAIVENGRKPLIPWETAAADLEFE